ncbi:hypothetical protein OCU04_001848 [Sclerotinia nivalis]|uniref:Myb-like DNA-binding domain-containing protein n=1 Tax=Sclerotinia nivalis TaxID=352851 RepID=A0A9X0B0S2_9HELO|nr:hypothetical protein OCU04_001848 [Sclerotinia nivalis]
MPQRCMPPFLIDSNVSRLTSQIDWNKVAHDPVLSQEITNGHAARMRYSRFKKQMDGTTSMPTGPRKIATPRRSRVEKKKSAKREPKFKNRKDSLEDVRLPFLKKSESQDNHTCPSTSMRAMEMDRNNPLSTLKITNFEPTTPATSHFKMETESDLFLPFPTTPSEASRLPTPFLMDSPTSPKSSTFPTPGVISLNSSMSTTASLNNRMMDTSFFGPPLYKQTENKESIGAGRRDGMRYRFDPWNQDMGGFDNIPGAVEDRGSVMFKREESFEDASYESFMK